MIGEWTPNTKYYLKMPTLALQTILPEMVKEKFGYDLEQDWKLEDVCRNVKYLENDEVAISNQIVLPHNLGTECVDKHITEEAFEESKLYFGVEEFLTLEEYRELKQIEILI